MHIISWAKIRDFVDRHPTSPGSMRTWFDCLESRMYKDFNDLRTISSLTVGVFALSARAFLHPAIWFNNLA